MPNDQVRRRRDSAMISRMRSSCAAVNGCSGWQAIMLLPFVRGADMLPNPWGAGLRPAPVRSTVGLQHHHGEALWTNKRAPPSRPLRPGSQTLSASSRSEELSTRAMCQAYSSSCSTPSDTRATSSRFVRYRRGLNGSYRAHRIAFRFPEKHVGGGHPPIGFGRRHAATCAGWYSDMNRTIRLAVSKLGDRPSLRLAISCGSPVARRPNRVGRISVRLRKASIDEINSALVGISMHRNVSANADIASRMSASSEIDAS